MEKRVFLVGYMGSGKTTIGRMLAERLGFTFFDTDKCVESKRLKSVSRIFETEGEDTFRELERKCLHELADFEDVVISTGGGAPCFFDNMQYMNERGMTVYLKWSAKELANRLQADNSNKRPLLARLKGEELEAFIAEGLAKREAIYLQADAVASGTEEEILSQITGKM
jgi:shikimate kinase